MEGKMRAACYEAFGDAGVIKTCELDIPGLKEAEVLVKVKAAAVNPVDAAVRKGLLKGLPVVFPAIPGWDMTGIIEERGFAARRFNTGDEVYAYARRPVVQWGTYAQYIVIPESYLASRPQTLSWEETAGIPLAGLTAYQSLFTTGHLHSGQTVLILGASGGVGTLAIQLATAKGAQVTGVASEKNHAYMKELGAAHTIDYHNTDIGEAIKQDYPGGVDLIFDAAGGDTLKRSLPALKKNGTVVSIVDRGTEIDKSIHFHFVFTDPNATDLEQLRELADAGKIKVPVSEIYGLDEAAEAMRQIETHHTRGKMVIVPW